MEGGMDGGREGGREVVGESARERIQDQGQFLPLTAWEPTVPLQEPETYICIRLASERSLLPTVNVQWMA